MISGETTQRGVHQYLYLRHWSTGAVSIDLVKHHDEIPEPVHPIAPYAKVHSVLTDALILKWFDMHGCNSAWDIALHLGGQPMGYTAEWILQRYCYIVDEVYESPRDEASVSPLLVVEAQYATEVDPQKPTVFIGCGPPESHEPSEPELLPETPTPPPTEPEETRPPTPEKPIIDIIVGGRRSWTPESDKLVLEWVEAHGQNWRALARYMGGRRVGFSDDAVRNRYLRIKKLKSTRGRFVRGTPTRGPRWTPTEDDMITQFYGEGQHNRWKHIAALLNTDRTPAAVRLRAQRLGLFEYRGKADPS